MWHHVSHLHELHRQHVCSFYIYVWQLQLTNAHSLGAWLVLSKSSFLKIRNCPFTGGVWFSLRIYFPSASYSQSKLQWLSLRVSVPLDPSRKMRPNCIILIFIWSWAAAQRHLGARRVHRASHLSLHAFIWKRKNKRKPRHKYTLAGISGFCGLRLVGHAVISTRMCLSERIWAGARWWRGGPERGAVGQAVRRQQLKWAVRVVVCVSLWI